MKLFYRKYGEGQPLIILHGIFGISDNWVTIGRRLAEKFEVYIPDQRNHGQSPHSSTFNYFALIDDLFEFIEDHQLINPIIIGHSMGGKVAMNFALENPGKIDKLIVVDISTRAYTGRQEHQEIIHAMRSVNFDNISSREEVADIISKSVKSEKIQLFVLKNLYRINQERYAWRLNVDGIYENIENVFEGVQSPYVFKKECLFIKGGNSGYITEEDYESIRIKFPKAVFTTIKDASHWVHAEKPDELCAQLSLFLNKQCEYKP
ncbi:MAG: alpha/beta fold hydrolase [Bacteroidales bacterium]|nr:alpha/beta fold hydrolase [Bacteroidales bacterium]MCF8402666.1 alpha/beta fold hydrolase [Bacteroidales bacterium]